MLDQHWKFAKEEDGETKGNGKRTKDRSGRRYRLKQTDGLFWRIESNTRKNTSETIASEETKSIIGTSEFGETGRLYWKYGLKQNINTEARKQSRYINSKE